MESLLYFLCFTIKDKSLFLIIFYQLSPPEIMNGYT